MKSVYAIGLLALCPIAIAILSAQQPPQATDLPSDPFFIKNTWIIGGTGSWDYLTMDSSAGRLYIAHSHSVQVVDVSTGTLAGMVSDLVDLIRLWRGFSTEIFLGKKRNLCYTLPIPWG